MQGKIVTRRKDGHRTYYFVQEGGIEVGPLKKKTKCFWGLSKKHFYVDADGKKQGPFEETTPSGGVNKGYYKDDEFHGDIKYYTADGHMCAKCSFNNGNCIDLIRYYADGTVLEHNRYARDDSFTGLHVDYEEWGKLYEVSLYEGYDRKATIKSGKLKNLLNSVMAQNAKAEKKPQEALKATIQLFSIINALYENRANAFATKRRIVEAVYHPHVDGLTSAQKREVRGRTR